MYMLDLIQKKISIKIEFGGYSSFELMEKLLEKEVARVYCI